MAYNQMTGRRPRELASKATHQYVIKDEHVKSLLQVCEVPEREPIDPGALRLSALATSLEQQGIEIIMTVDGGTSEIAVRSTFPSATIGFFQFGALLFKTEDLIAVEKMPFPGPEEMSKLKNLERFKLAIPVRNVRLKGSQSLTHSIRKAIHDFFTRTRLDKDPLAAGLKWLIFEEFRGTTAVEEWNLGQNPYTGKEVVLRKSEMAADFTFKCPDTGKPIYLIDVFRLHEAIDDELGAAGIFGYLTNVCEMMLIVQMMMEVSRLKPDLFARMLFIKDGPLGFFGQTARLHKPMRAAIRYLSETYGFNMLGLEKSGAFVDHAWEARESIPLGSALILGNSYIYRHITPGRSSAVEPYGATSMFGAKVIYRSQQGYVHVMSVPTLDSKAEPEEKDFICLQTAMAAVEKLHCHMHDNAIVPIALANQLVSLATRPSQAILKAFAKATMGS